MKYLVPLVKIALFVACLLFWWGVWSLCHAEEINWYEVSTKRIVRAIYYAEGGSKTSHPYGILAHYKHTTPKQACINTVEHAKRDYRAYNGKLDFIEFLGSRYCPVGAKNDPKGLNKNWVRNVKILIYSKLKGE